jgi:hypothetical protein
LQLVQIGKAAIPELQKAMDDKRLSRAPASVTVNFGFSDRILTVGDCAAIVLREIESNR